MDLKLQAILDAANTGINVIKTVAALPGVSALPYVSTLAGGIDLLQRIAKFGGDVIPLANRIKATFAKPEVSPDDMASLDAEIAAERAKLHAPMPPKEDDEPE